MINPIRYITDAKGNKTAVIIDLHKSNSDAVLQNLNSLQLDFLKLIANGFPDEYTKELRELIANFLAEKILDNGDRIVKERNYTKETFSKLVEND